MRDITVLLTGTGAPGAPGIINCLRRAWDRKIRIVGVDMNENAGGRGMVDAFYVVPPAAAPDFIDRILEVCIKEKVDVIEPIVTKELIRFAEAKNRFEAVGTKIVVMDAEILAMVNNKARLLERIQAAGLPCAKFKVAHSVDELKKAFTELGYPEKALVVKATEGDGSRGVRIVDPNISRYDLFFNSKPNSMYISYSELISVLSEKPEIPEMMVMEFLPGSEYSVDFLADKGEIIYAVCRRGLSVVTSNMMSLEISDNPKVLGLCSAVVKELKLSGNFGFDLMCSKNDEQPYAVEINPRLTAGIVSAAAAGVNLPYAGIKRVLGEELPECMPKIGTRMSRRYKEEFFDPQGKPFEWE